MSHVDDPQRAQAERDALFHSFLCETQAHYDELLKVRDHALAIDQAFARAGDARARALDLGGNAVELDAVHLVLPLAARQLSSGNDQQEPVPVDVAAAVGEIAERARAAGGLLELVYPLIACMLVRGSPAPNSAEERARQVRTLEALIRRDAAPIPTANGAT